MPLGHMFYIVLYREKHVKIFLSEPTRLRALIFRMNHHLVNLCQVCSNHIPGAKNGPPRESHVLNRENMKKSSCLKPVRLRSLIFGMEHHLVDLYQVCLYYAPGAKNGPAPGVTRDMVSFQQIPIYKLLTKLRWVI